MTWNEDQGQTDEYDNIQSVNIYHHLKLEQKKKKKKTNQTNNKQNKNESKNKTKKKKIARHFYVVKKNGSYFPQ